MKLKRHKNISLIKNFKLLYSMDIKLLWQTAINISKDRLPVSGLGLGLVHRSHFESHCLDRIETV